MIVVDSDGLFDGVFMRTFQYNLLIPVHAVSRDNQKASINEEFQRYLNNFQKINSVGKFSLFQFLRGVFFELYAWNPGPVDRTDIA